MPTSPSANQVDATPDRDAGASTSAGGGCGPRGVRRAQDGARERQSVAFRHTKASKTGTFGAKTATFCAVSAGVAFQECPDRAKVSSFCRIGVAAGGGGRAAAKQAW